MLSQKDDFQIEQTGPQTQQIQKYREEQAKKHREGRQKIADVLLKSIVALLDSLNDFSVKYNFLLSPDEIYETTYNTDSCTSFLIEFNGFLDVFFISIEKLLSENNFSSLDEILKLASDSNKEAFNLEEIEPLIELLELIKKILSNILKKINDRGAERIQHDKELRTSVLFLRNYLDFFFKKVSQINENVPETKETFEAEEKAIDNCNPGHNDPMQKLGIQGLREKIKEFSNTKNTDDELEEAYKNIEALLKKVDRPAEEALLKAFRFRYLIEKLLHLTENFSQTKPHTKEKSLSTTLKKVVSLKELSSKSLLKDLTSYEINPDDFFEQAKSITDFFYGLQLDITFKDIILDIIEVIKRPYFSSLLESAKYFDEEIIKIYSLKLLVQCYKNGIGTTKNKNGSLAWEMVDILYRAEPKLETTVQRNSRRKVIGEEPCIQLILPDEAVCTEFKNISEWIFYEKNNLLELRARANPKRTLLPTHICLFFLYASVKKDKLFNSLKVEGQARLFEKSIFRKQFTPNGLGQFMNIIEKLYNMGFLNKQFPYEYFMKKALKEIIIQINESENPDKLDMSVLFRYHHARHDYDMEFSSSLDTTRNSYFEKFCKRIVLDVSKHQEIFLFLNSYLIMLHNKNSIKINDKNFSNLKFALHTIKTCILSKLKLQTDAEKILSETVILIDRFIKKREFLEAMEKLQAVIVLELNTNNKIFSLSTFFSFPSPPSEFIKHFGLLQEHLDDFKKQISWPIEGTQETLSEHYILLEETKEILSGYYTLLNELWKSSAKNQYIDPLLKLIKSIEELYNCLSPVDPREKVTQKPS